MKVLHLQILICQTTQQALLEKLGISELTLIRSEIFSPIMSGKM